jgi:hypothetical protein
MLSYRARKGDVGLRDARIVGRHLGLLAGTRGIQKWCKSATSLNRNICPLRPQPLENRGWTRFVAVERGNRSLHESFSREQLPFTNPGNCCFVRFFDRLQRFSFHADVLVRGAVWPAGKECLFGGTGKWTAWECPYDATSDPPHRKFGNMPAAGPRRFSQILAMPQNYWKIQLRKFPGIWTVAVLRCPHGRTDSSCWRSRGHCGGKRRDQGVLNRWAAQTN